MNTSIRSDIKILAALVAAVAAMATADITYQVAALDCADRAPAIARMCR